MNRRLANSLPLAVLAIAVAGGSVLRAWRLGERSMWFDESVSYATITRFSWAEMIERTGQAVHPPLYYIVLRLWSLCWGTSLTSLRALSVALGAATIVGVYLFCRDTFGPCAVEADRAPSAVEHGARNTAACIAATAAALLATSSVHIVWSQEARMYMLGACLAAFSTWSLVRALRSGRPQWWALYTLLAAAFIYTHNFAAFTIFAQACFAFLAPAWKRPGDGWNVGRRSSLQTLAALAAVVLLYLPWAPTLVRQATRVNGDYWIPPVRAWTLPNAWYDLVVPRNGFEAPPRLAVVVVAADLLAVVFVAWRAGKMGGRLVALLVLVPVACALAVSAFGTSIIIDRYFLFAQLFLLCALARAVWVLPGAPLRIAATVTLLSGGLLLHQRHWTALERGRAEGLSAAVAHVMRRRQADEPLIVVNPALFQAVRYYASDEAPVRLFAPERLSHYNGGPLLLPGDVCDDLALAASHARRAWVFDSSGFQSSFPRYRLTSVWRPRDGTQRSFREANYFQGAIYVTEYERREDVAVGRIR
ncbi:MAG TPA: glycosyltransferase family 39 protein [Pirellulales bacterium]|nr:glycosyltransferase family 39 protein [Pirellulales bacterium]